MKKLTAVLFAVSLTASAVLAATNGSDNAADPAYSGGWNNSTNGGTVGTFNPWDLTNNNNDPTNSIFAGYFLGDSTLGSGNINTAGQSFAIYANPSSAFADADRSFGSALDVGQTFSLQVAVNFRNGNKGFNLDAGATQIFNFNVGGNDYSVNGNSLGLAYDPAAVFSLSFTQTTLTAGTWTILLDGNSFSGNTGAYIGGDASGFVLYNSGTDDGSAANNLYFNNLAIVPEPSSLTLLAGPAILGAWFFLRRRRRTA